MKKPTSGTTDLTTGRPLTRILVFALPLVYRAAAGGAGWPQRPRPAVECCGRQTGNTGKPAPHPALHATFPHGGGFAKNVRRPKFIIDFSRSLCGTAVFLYPLTKAVSLCYLMSG